MKYIYEIYMKYIRNIYEIFMKYIRNIYEIYIYMKYMYNIYIYNNHITIILLSSTTNVIYCRSAMGPTSTAR